MNIYDSIINFFKCKHTHELSTTSEPGFMDKLPNNSKLFMNGLGKWVEIKTDTPPSPEKICKTITQPSHGLAAGDVVKILDVKYKKAIATYEVGWPFYDYVVGIVSEVISADEFILTTHGHVTGIRSMPGVGILLFLSDTVAGELTEYPPTSVGTYEKPCFLTTSFTSGYFFNQRGLPN